MMMKSQFTTESTAQRTGDNRFVVVFIDGVHQDNPMQARIPTKK